MKKLFVLMIALMTIYEARAGWDNSNFPGPASDGYTGFVIGTKAYVGFGLGSAKMFSFDSKSLSWTTLSTPPCGTRAWAIGFSINGKGYVGGGDPNGDFHPTKEFWQYDPAKDSWKQIANFGGGVRDGAATFTLNGKGYVVGGFDGTNVLSEVWTYDPNSDKWSLLSQPFPGGPIIFGGAFVIDGYGYVCTGASNVEQTYCYKFDPSTESWTQMADFPGLQRQTAVGFEMNGKGYIGLGEAGYSTSFTDFYEYNPVNNKWKAMPDMNFPNSSTGWSIAFGFGDFAIVGTGTSLPNFQYSNKIYTYGNLTQPTVSQIGVNITELDFDSVEVSKNKILTFEISNTGTKELTISYASFTPSSVSTFTSNLVDQINISAIKIPVGGKQTYNVTFSPTDAAEEEATLVINSDATNQPEVKIELYGTGYVKSQPKMEASVTSLEFGNVELGKSDSLTFGISNTGNVVLNDVLIEITNDPEGNFKLLSYNTKFTAIQGQHYTPEISFNPVSEGDKTALLRVSADESTTPLLEIPLKGKGIPSTGVKIFDKNSDDLLIETAPNPVHENLTLRIKSKSINKQLSIAIYSLTGEKIKEIYNGTLNEGNNVIQANTNQLAEGIYYVEAETQGKVSRQKIVIVR